MKKFLKVLIAIMVISNFGFGQSKIYNISNTRKSKPVKGTFTLLKLTGAGSRDETSFVGAGTVAATIGPALINSGVGFLRNSLEKKKERATVSISTAPISFDLTSEVKFDLITNYYEKSNDAGPKEMRKINFIMDFNSGTGYLRTELAKLTSTFSQAYIKKKRNLLIYEISLNGRAFYTDKNKKELTKDFSISYLFPHNANTVFTSNQFNITPLPKGTSFITISATIKEVNPYYNNGISLAKFLENYGENVTNVLAGILIEQGGDE